MKLYSILSALAVCMGLVSQEAGAVTCEPGRLPSNPDTAYTFLANGTATHAPTGLMWKRCSEGQNWDGSTCTGTANSYTWRQALAAASTSSFADYTDWRLPNVKELRSLVEECRYNPAINDAIFPATPFQVFWSSSPQINYSGWGDWSWTVDFSGGTDSYSERFTNWPARLVRGGDYFDKLAPPATSLLSVSANGSGTVSAGERSINCTANASSLSGTCLATPRIGSSVTLTASGGTFNGWSGFCSSTSGNSCTVLINAARAVTANFSGGTPATASAPSAPTGLLATPGDSSASIAFSSSGTATSYSATCIAGASTLTGGAYASPIAITGMSNGTPYSCTVTAGNSAGSSAPSAPVSVTPVASTVAPSAPTGLVAIPGDSSASIAFSLSGTATSYSAACTAGASTPLTGTGPGSPIVITGMSNGAAYSCTVLAHNSAGNSAPSAAVSVTPSAAAAATTGCYPLSNPTDTSIADAHNGSVTVTNVAGSGCSAWGVTNNNPAWITPLPPYTAVGATSYIIGYTVAANPSASLRTGTLSFGDAPNTRTYTITQYGTGGAPAPSCTLTALPASIATGSAATLTASCTPSATTYVWTGGNCASTATASCTDTPGATTTYTVAGVNSVGTGAAASATVTVGANVTNSGAVAGTLITRYRLYSNVTKEHLYTTDLNEYNTLAQSGSWVAEGAIYQVFQGPGSSSGVAAVPYYRLSNPNSGLHHWTTDLNEYTTLATLGWTQEGIVGYILPTTVPGTLPLYRLYLNALGGLHLWTTDANERSVLISTAGWVDEGVAGYVIPLP